MMILYVAREMQRKYLVSLGGEEVEEKFGMSHVVPSPCDVASDRSKLCIVCRAELVNSFCRWLYFELPVSDESRSEFYGFFEAA